MHYSVLAMGESFCRKRRQDPAASSLPSTHTTVLVCDRRLEAPAGDGSPGAHCVCLFTARITHSLSVIRTDGVLASSPHFLGRRVPGSGFSLMWIPPEKEAFWQHWLYLQRASTYTPPSESTSMPIQLWLQMAPKCSGLETSPPLPWVAPPPGVCGWLESLQHWG